MNEFLFRTNKLKTDVAKLGGAASLLAGVVSIILGYGLPVIVSHIANPAQFISEIVERTFPLVTTVVAICLLFHFKLLGGYMRSVLLLLAAIALPPLVSAYLACPTCDVREMLHKSDVVSEIDAYDTERREAEFEAIKRRDDISIEEKRRLVGELINHPQGSRINNPAQLVGEVAWFMLVIYDRLYGFAMLISSILCGIFLAFAAAWLISEQRNVKDIA
jgi:hypothetical protein